MSDTPFLFPPPPVVSLPVVGRNERFPVNRIYCVGRNYAAHAREMGDDPDRNPPFFFCKDASCVHETPFDSPTPIQYPAATHQLEYEVELVVAIGKGGRNIPVSQAGENIFGLAVGLDMTRRDLQGQAKSKGRPWETGKSFEESAPISPILPYKGALPGEQIELSVDGEQQQSSGLSYMTWSMEEIISNLSHYFELHPGDLIMTGTPEGVGAVERGQTMQATIEGLGQIVVFVV